MSAFDLDGYLKERRALVDAALERFLPGEDTPPPTVHRAMRYSVMAGGKRLRPILVIAGAEAVGATPAIVMPTACALELIHTYSLIHDDLPVMDDDDYRRGKLTNHKVYGDAMAILAGDALLTHAFEVLNSPPLTQRFPAALLQQVSYRVARAAGSFGMIGGQVVDIVSEGKQVPLEVLEYIHRHKTAALLTASVTVGGLLGDGTPEQVQSLERYGHDVGWAYQIADDLLDVEGDAVTIGKEVGRDAVLEKVTYPA